MEGVKENAEVFSTLGISLHEQNLLLALNSKAWEGKEQPTVWEQQVKELLRRESSGCNLF